MYLLSDYTFTDPPTEGPLGGFTLSVFGCAESQTSGLARLKSHAKEIVLAESGSKRVETAFRENKDDHADFGEGYFLTLDGNTISVYRKMYVLSQGYISSSMDTVVKLVKMLKLAEAPGITCQEGYPECLKCGQSETRYITRPVAEENIKLCNVLSQLSQHSFFKEKYCDYPCEDCREDPCVCCKDCQEDPCLCDLPDLECERCGRVVNLIPCDCNEY